METVADPVRWSAADSAADPTGIRRWPPLLIHTAGPPPRPRPVGGDDAGMSLRRAVACPSAV